MTKPPLHLPRSAGPRISRGLTLVELLVAVTIGLLLTVVIAQLFLGSRQTFATTDDLSRMQENIRYAQQLLIRTIHLSAYKSQPNSITATVFSGANEALVVTPGATASASDTLVVRYQGSRGASGTADGTVQDCLGNRIDAGVYAVNTFTIQASPTTGRNGLFCNGQEVVPDVENMQIVVGEDTTVGAGDYTANRYVDWTTVADPTRVVTVRVALLFTSPTDTSKVVPDNVTTYNLNGVDLGPFNDRRLRRPMTTTINLRNRTP